MANKSLSECPECGNNFILIVINMQKSARNRKTFLAGCNNNNCTEMFNYDPCTGRITRRHK